MPTPTFTPVNGVILNISQTSGQCCSQTIILQTSQGMVHFLVSNSTYIVDNIRLRKGMRITAFYDNTLPVPLIYPPQYQAAFVCVTAPGESVAVNYFNKNLLAADNSLKLNIGNSTTVVTANGQRFTCSPGGNLLIVYYISTTRSIPPITTPRKIIVMY